MVVGWGGGGRGAHIRAAFTTAEWCIPLYTRAGQPSGLTDLKTTVYSTAQLQQCEELLSKTPHIHPSTEATPPAPDTVVLTQLTEKCYTGPIIILSI